MKTASNDIQARDIPDLNANTIEAQQNTGSTPNFPKIPENTRLIHKLGVRSLIILAIGYTIIAIFVTFAGLIFLALKHKPSPDILNGMFQSITSISFAALLASIIAFSIWYYQKRKHQ